MKTIHCVTLALILICGPLGTAEPFYYGSNGQVRLSIDSSLVAFQFDFSLTSEAQDSLIGVISRVDSIASEMPVPPTFTIAHLSVQSDYYAFLDSLRDITQILLAEPYYRTGSGMPMVAGDEICVGFRESVATSEIDSIVSAAGCSIVNSNKYGEYVIANSPLSRMPVLELANTLFLLDEVA